MNDEFAAYALMLMALVPLADWLRSWVTGTSIDETMLVEERRGETNFNISQNGKLAIAALFLGSGIFGLTVGFE